MIKKTTIHLVCSYPEHQSMRLDKFLYVQFPEYSRAYFQELIEEGLVLVNQGKTKSNYHVKKADQVTVTFKIKQYNLEPVPVAFDVIDQQDDFLIINKPAGLLVHSIAGSDEPSLVNGLLYHFKEIGGLSNDERPGIVHRLDKNTSGLMIIARNYHAHKLLSAMFKDRNIHKTYLALVSGNPEKKGSIDLPIGRHPIERHKMSTFGIDTRPALTHYKVLASYSDTALIAAHIITGRTHQIRVHCAALGHGLIGDDVYGVPSLLIARQALHSWKISFEFKGKNYSYSCPLPEDFKQLVAKCNQQKKKI